jgi:N-acyl amino acid synthase of PEP-CTERM/exosortase system
MSFNDAHDIYGRHFKVVLATNPAVLRAVYRLRYQVYCVEHAFERDGQLLDLEADAYDSSSLHAAIVHNASNTVCGCVRLILPHSSRLPISGLVTDPLASKHLDRLPRNNTAEVSRYAVAKAFRRRVGEDEIADAHFHQLPVYECRRLLPHITIGLMLAVSRLSLANGISHLCAVMAPSLLRLLRGFGMEFSKLGPVVDYHGRRQPCFATVNDLFDGLKRRAPEYYDYIRLNSDAPFDSPDGLPGEIFRRPVSAVDRAQAMASNLPDCADLVQWRRELLTKCETTQS